MSKSRRFSYVLTVWNPVRFFACLYPQAVKNGR
nr:MAG TPA: hypothetical protein [Caudoviricetes sp.]